jgi:hypothetical protein
MKTIKIIPDKEGFKIEHYETPDKRNDFEPYPCPYGFYHYPDNIQPQTAFNRLKKAMIEDKEKRIEQLKTEIKELKGLKYVEIPD